MSGYDPRLATRMTDEPGSRNIAERFGTAWTTLVLAGSVLAVAWPMWWVDVLALADYPQHLGTIAAIDGQDQASWASYFAVDYGRVQYVLLYLLSDWLADLCGVENATRLVTIAGVAGLPLAVAAFLRSHGRPALLGALAAATALHVYVFWGFINYCMAITLALLCLASLARLVRAPGPRNAAVYGGLVVLCFYTHAQLYAWVALASLVQVITMAPSVGRSQAWRGAWHGLIAAIPSVVAAVVWVIRSGLLRSGMAGQRSHIAPAVVDSSVRFASPTETLAHWREHSFDVYRHGDDEQLATAFLAVVAVLLGLRIFMALRRRGRPDQSGETAPRSAGARPHNWAPEAILGLALTCYLFAPVSYKLIEPISHRFLPLTLALVAVLGPVRMPDIRLRLLIGSALLSLAVCAGTVHNTGLQRAAAEVGQLDEALSHTKPGRRLLGLVFDRYSRVTRAPTWIHSQQYYQARIGGLAAFGFVEFPISPLVYRPGAEPPVFPIRFEWTPERLDYNRFRPYFDYYLVRTGPGQPAPAFWRGHRAPQLLFESPRWKLFERAP